jgi:hypothetical protein
MRHENPLRHSCLPVYSLSLPRSQGTILLPDRRLPSPKGIPLEGPKHNHIIKSALTEATLKRLHAQAQIEEESVSSVVRRAVKLYLRLNSPEKD